MLERTGAAQEIALATLAPWRFKARRELGPPERLPWAYDRKSPIGRLDKALDEAKPKGWTVVDMKRDWKRVFAFEA